MISNSCGSITQSIDLKTASLDLRYYLRFTSQISHDPYVLIGNYKRDQFVVDGGVLHQRTIGTQCTLKLGDRKVILLLACFSSPRFSMLELASEFQQFPFAFENCMFQFGISFSSLNRASN